MKRFKNISMCLIGVVLALVVSVCPRYYVFASSETPDQTVTSDDNIIQKLMDYTLSMWGTVFRSSNIANNVTKPDGVVLNRLKDTMAQLFNGGGIYVDENGDYVFTNEASKTIYNALMNNSNTDAVVVEDFSNFNTFSDGYVNSDYMSNINSLLVWVRTDPNLSGNYILVARRDYASSYVRTQLFAVSLPDNFGFLSIEDSTNRSLKIRNLSSQEFSVPYRSFYCLYYYDGGRYVTNSAGDSTTNYLEPLTALLSVDDMFNSFPNYDYTGSSGTNYKYSIYCNNSLILAKNIPSGNYLLNQSDGIYSSYTNIGTINKNTVNNNNWENIYNNYVQQVNVEYQDKPDMSASDLRKIMKKYTSTIVDAIQQGNANIEETISISNKYLQAISVDCRNISDKLDQIIQNGGGGGSSGGGLTEEQYNTLIGLINNINDHAVDIASNTDGSYLELQDISDNTATTNTNLVALKGVLDSINSKIRNKNTKPLPDPDFWDNLTDDLIDITDTVPEKFANAMTVIATAFKTVVPFGYIAVIGVLLSSLAEDPEEPIFEINLENDDGTIPLNWQGTIDLTWVADIMPIVRALECIVFIIGLIVFTFTVFNTLGSLFS